MTTYARLYEKKTACHAIALRLHLDGKHDMGAIWQRKAIELNDIMRHMPLGELGNDYKHKSTSDRLSNAIKKNSDDLFWKQVQSKSVEFSEQLHDPSN